MNLLKRISDWMPWSDARKVDRAFATRGEIVLSEDVPASVGRIIKVTSPPEFDPDKKRQAGRIVKAMPRQLKKIKEGQEREIPS